MLSDARSSGRGLLAAGALALAALLAWLVMRGPAPEEPADDVVVTEAASPAPAPIVAPPAAPAPTRPAVAPAAVPAEEHVADDGLPFMPASPDAARPTGPVHPHPITPKHQRIFAENRLVGALNGAMDVKDVPAMRRFLREYRAQYPEDDNDLQVGYQVIADCLEHPDDASRAAALRFGDEHRGSTLRRFVNRHCLEPQPPP